MQTLTRRPQTKQVVAGGAFFVGCALRREVVSLEQISLESEIALKQISFAGKKPQNTSPCRASAWARP